VSRQKEKQKYRVTILARDDVTTFTEEGEPVEVRRTVYVAAGLSPAPVEIPREEWTLEKEKELVRKDIERRLKEKPETYEV